jgi:hypothetical protein
MPAAASAEAARAAKLEGIRRRLHDAANFIARP